MVRDAYPDLMVVGFKLESVSGDALIERAKEVMNRYDLAMVVANIVESRGMMGGVGHQ